MPERRADFVRGPRGFNRHLRTPRCATPDHAASIDPPT